MYKIALVALLIGLLWSLPARSEGPSGRLTRFVLASFGAFGVVSAMLWMVAPGGMARTVVAAGGGDLTLRIVQARGAIVLPFGIAALLAATSWPQRRWAIAAGPFAYNAAMAIEALRVQFTVLATPERWLYVGLHGFWAIGLGAYALPLLAGRWTRVGERPLPASVAAIVALAGLALIAAPAAIVPGSIATDPLLFHSARAFGSSLFGFGVFGAGSAVTEDGQSQVGGLLVWLAALLLALVAALSGAWLLALPPLLFAAALALPAPPPRPAERPR